MIEHQCAQCGICCSKRVFDIIYITGREVNKILERFGGPVSKYFKAYGFGNFEKDEEMETIFTLKFLRGRCPFQQNNKCSIHDIRPRTCQEYPRKTHWEFCVHELHKRPKDVLQERLQEASPEQFVRMLGG